VKMDAESFDADAGDNCPYCYCEHKNLSVDSQPPYFDGEVAWVEIQCDDCNMKATAPTYEFEFDKQGILEEVGLPIAVNMMNPNYGTVRCSRCHERFEKSAEGLEFTDWAKQEHHGKKTSLKDWADHEIKTHGKSMSFQDWAKHEDKSHLRRYGAEEEGQTKIGETSAWEGRILGMNGKWRDGVYDIFRIMGAKTDDPYQRPIGYTMIHQGIDLSPENFTTDLGQLSTDVGEINFAGMTIGTGGDGSWPLWGAYEDIEDYYVRAQNKPKPTLSPDAKKEDYYNEDFRGRRQLWDDEFTNWLSKGDEGYPNKHKAQLEHQVLVGVRLGLANPISPTLRTKNAKGTFWVIEYPSLKHMITDVYSRQKPDKMYEYANTEHTVNQYFNNLKSLYPDGKFSEVARTEYQAAKKEFYIILPAFGWYQWTAMEYPLGYASPSREETARKEKRRLEIAMKQQTEREEMQKRERKEKYGAEHPSGEGKLKVSGQDFADGSLMVGVGTEDLGVGDPDLVEMMIDKDGKIGKLKTEKETNTTPGGDFNRFYAESFEAQAPRGHKMMTKELGKKIPPLYSQDGKGDEAIVYAHYFNPYGVGEWWILEWDGENEMFGYADLGFPELGYISLSELENVSIGGMELPIERDLHWQEKTLGEVKEAMSKYRAKPKALSSESGKSNSMWDKSGSLKPLLAFVGFGVIGGLIGWATKETMGIWGAEEKQAINPTDPFQQAEFDSFSPMPHASKVIDAIMLRERTNAALVDRYIRTAGVPGIEVFDFPMLMRRQG